MADHGEEDDMDVQATTTLGELGSSPSKPAGSSSSKGKEGKDKDKSSIKGSGVDQIQLPIARVKKIIKADKDVKYLSGEASILLAKSAELFLEYLVTAAYERVKREKRRTLNYNDVATVVSEMDVLEFLTDVIPKQKPKREVKS
eukprot:TRINITY_DN2085_c0_g1_i1.p2 TRINITY_DN2085_c0_g1~~TRINITY_DN2085_c0_g1_i1.p2  ORF type:complete len:144 (+),score=44.85 TRINITY_DN2085_c0_g1_i1:166-597(+)